MFAYRRRRLGLRLSLCCRSRAGVRVEQRGFVTAADTADRVCFVRVGFRVGWGFFFAAGVGVEEGKLVWVGSGTVQCGLVG